MSYVSDAAMTDLATLKAWMNPTSDTSADTALTSLIARASAFILDCIDVPRLMDDGTNVVERRNGTGSSTIVTRQFPITGVTSVLVNNVAIPASVDGLAAGYVADRMSISLVSGCFPRGLGNIFLGYMAGFAPTSYDLNVLEEICLELCAQKWKRRAHVDQTSASSNGIQTAAFSLADMPKEVRLVLDQFRRIGSVFA